MSLPTVSIIIPTFNRETLLPRALDSVLAQTLDDWEIIVIDDGSTDQTAAVVATYARRLKDRFIYLRQANRGSSHARNHGIDICNGRLVAFLDSDDEFLPNKLERQLDLFNRRSELGFVYSDFAFVDLDGARHDSAFDVKCPVAREVPFDTIDPGLCVCTGSLFDTLIRQYFIATIVGMVRREVLGDTIRFPVDQSYAEEWLFYLKVARTCRAGFVNEPLCVHHFVPGSLARTDKHRNTVRRRELLKAIKESFDDLNREHRRALHGNLANTCRQLGYDALRAGRHRDAFWSFAESFRYEPSAQAPNELLRSAAGWLCGRMRGAWGAGRRTSQAASEAVR